MEHKNKKNINIAVVIHLYHEEQWSSINSALSNFEPNFTLFVTVRLGSLLSKEILNSYPEAIIKQVKNVGRDVAPFLYLLPKLVNFDAVCKIHTKRDGVRHTNWRKSLIHGLLGSRQIIEQYIDCFIKEPNLALAGPKDFFLDGPIHEMANKTAIHLMYGPRLENYGFFAGTMFWCRPSVYIEMANSYPRDCFIEHQDSDEQPEHIVERAFGIIASKLNKKIMLWDGDTEVFHANCINGNKNINKIYEPINFNVHKQRNKKNSFKQKSTGKITHTNKGNTFEDSNIKDLKNISNLNENQSVNEKFKSNKEYFNDNDLFINIAKISKKLMAEGRSYDNYVSLAQSESSAGLFLRAERSWRSAISYNNDKDTGTAYIGLAQILLKKGKINQAIEILDNIDLQVSKNIDAFKYLSLANLHLGNWLNALKFANIFIKVNSEDIDIRLCRSRANFELKNIDEARNDIRFISFSGNTSDTAKVLETYILTSEEEYELALFLASELCEKYPDSAICLEAFRKAFNSFSNAGQNARFTDFLNSLKYFTNQTKAPIRSKKKLLYPNRIDVIIPVHNAWNTFKACIYSVLSTECETLGRIIIVDDGSNKDTKIKLQNITKKNKKILLLTLQKQSGYSNALAFGIKNSKSQAFVALNSDTIVTKEWLYKLSSILMNSKSIAMVGPLSNNAAWQNYDKILDSRGNFKKSQVPSSKIRDSICAEKNKKNKNSLTSVNLLHGFCVLVNREIYDEIGGIDLTSFPEGYGEFQDLSIRLNMKGYKLIVCRDCIVFHERGASISEPHRISLSLEGRKTLYNKYTALNYLSVEMATIINAELHLTT